ncbi:porin [Haloferula sargassicola]|uniref:Alginate export domain-containing protein n=1 Tax=Haloferula sargassicola TaxID=490096 RepID=A0ABP9UP87_9BACT
MNSNDLHGLQTPAHRGKASPPTSPQVRSHIIGHLRLRRKAALLLLGLTTPPSPGFDFLGTPDAEETASFERFWDGFTLYQNRENPILQEFKLRGRYQGQYYDIDASQGSVSDWEDRRSRLGFDARLFDSRLEARLDFQSNDGFRDGYDGLVDAYVKWKASDDIDITLGRTKPFIGYYDWLQSSNNQPTFERSQIFNQLNIDRATGLTVEGRNPPFLWQVGLFSNSVDPDRNSFSHALGNFDASWSLSLGAGYDFSRSTGFARNEVRLNWIHSDRDTDSNVLSRYEDVVSATWWWQDGPWSLVTEAFYATGGQGSNGNVGGGYLLGTYDLIPKRLQLVGRCSVSHGDGPSSVRLQSRYESQVTAARGDTYHALYLGAQYFIHGDKLKLMAGGEYAKLSGGVPGTGYDGFTWLSGIRFSF